MSNENNVKYTDRTKQAHIRQSAQESGYRAAARSLHKKEVPVTRVSLGLELGKKPAAVRMYLLRHKWLVIELGVLTNAKAREILVLKACERVVEKVSPRSRRMTYRTFAAWVGIRRSYLTSKKRTEKVKITLDRIVSGKS